MGILTNYQRKALVFFLLLVPACAQSFNFNLGGGPGFSHGTAAEFMHNSYNFVVGGGLNLQPHIRMNVEFMFHGIPAHHDIIQQVGHPIWKAGCTLWAVTWWDISARGKKEFIWFGDAGWYRRTLEATQTVLQQGTVCAPFWEWWNVQCVDGICPTDVTVGSRTVAAPGVNVGGGYIWSRKVPVEPLRGGSASSGVYL